MYTSDLSEVVF